MRVGMNKSSCKVVACSGTSTQQHYYCTSITKQAQQLSFKSQQSRHHRSLNHTHQLGQPSSSPSQRWEEYMGVKDWAGLLNPLDDHLRDHILRYGTFIEATYRGFDFDPGSPSYASSKHPKHSFFQGCGLPISGYRVTRHLRATSGIELPGWARSRWAPVQTSWIGYVAVCNEKAMIDQLGRREVVIALRGTATCLEWVENVRATLAPVRNSNDNNNKNNNVGVGVDGPPMVESGFLSLYTSRTEMWPSLQDTIRSEVKRILKVYRDQAVSITITGHSLGAALATLAAYDIKTTFVHAPLVTVISFGGPRVGNESFRSLLDNQGTKILRVVNPSDLITKLPGFFLTDDQFLNVKQTNIGNNNTPNNQRNTQLSGKLITTNTTHNIKSTTTTTTSRHRRIGKTKIHFNTTKSNFHKIKSTKSHFDKIKISCSRFPTLKGITSHVDKIKSSISCGNNNSNSNSNSSSGSITKSNPLARYFQNWIQQFPVEDSSHWWVYAEVGRELRLENKDTEQLTYYLNNMDVAKCHDLKTYLNLVEYCPIKNLVRRSLNKLTQHCNVHNEPDSGILGLLCK